jgi:hypothetical protein
MISSSSQNPRLSGVSPPNRWKEYAAANQPSTADLVDPEEGSGIPAARIDRAILMLGYPLGDFVQFRQPTTNSAARFNAVSSG